MPIILEGGFQETHTETYPSPFRESIPAFELEGLQFGGHHNSLQVSDFSPGIPEMRDQDVQDPVGDGVYFGRDYLAPPTWGFDLFTNVDNWTDALSLDGLLRATWLNPELRNTPGQAVPLRYLLAGRWRRVYGRPRRFVGGDGGGVLTKLGRSEMTADFKLAHHLHYADEEKSVQVGMVPPDFGGFTFPLEFPISSTPRTASQRASQFRVGGDAPTWPRITIEGPITDAVVSVGAWSMKTVGHIAYDQTLVVDAAPWAQSILRGDGAPVPGMLHPTVSMAGLALPPGDHDLKLEGSDATGTARATIAWRDAYYGI